MAAEAPNPYFFPDPPESAQAFERSLGNYFFFKGSRRPTFLYEPKPQLPDPDQDRAAWDDILTKKQYSFVTQQHLDEAGVAADSVIRDDVKMLNRTLVRAFIDEDYNANYWQNQYFLFQWMFTIFALLATIFAALTTVATVSEATASSLTSESAPARVAPFVATAPATSLPGATPNAPLPGTAPDTLQSSGSMATLFGILTTIVGVIVTVLVYIYNKDRPQRAWHENRRNAESLRKQYFLYLTHMPPYDNQKHVFALQKMTARIQNSDPKKLDIAADTPPRMPAHTALDNPILIKLYNTLRIQVQMTYYMKRSREYDFNADVTLLVTLIIPLIVSLVAGLNIAQISPTLAIIVVVLPNLGGLFATFQRVYDWERQQVVYKKTFEGLQEAKILDTLGKNPDAILRELVDAIETELTKESDQWGASVGENTPDLSAEQIIDAFKKKVDSTDEEINGELDQMRVRLKLK